ncbi:MAG: DNA polymerase III subunit beta [Planctomycetaceae bacterium]|nr:DNA polymerase III subunit beta [Planctomycetaceae bacterium]
MRVTVPVREFRDAFNEASGLIRNNSPKEVYKYVRVRPDGEGIELTGTNGEVSVSVFVMAEKTQNDVFLLPAARVGGILRTLPSNATLDIEVVTENSADGKPVQKVTLKSAGSRFSIPTMQPDEFPNITDMDAVGTISLDAKILADAFSRTSFACDVASTRYALGGLLLDASIGDGKLRVVSTDTRRLSEVTIAAIIESSSGASIPNQPVVPVQAVSAFGRCEHSGPAEIQVGENSVRITCQSTTITARLIAGRFPRYSDVIPTQMEHRVDLVAGALWSACQQASVLTSEESRGVDFTFGDGNLVLSSSVADLGESEIKIPVSWDREVLEIRLQPAFVADCVKTLPADKSVEIGLNDGNSQMLITVPDAGWRYVVMPLA